MKLYQVVHNWDEDGGFGDAVWQQDVLATFENKEDAEEYAQKFADPHVYDVPYAALGCGDLKVEEIEVISHGEFPAWVETQKEEDMWWLNTDRVES